MKLKVYREKNTYLISERTDLPFERCDVKELYKTGVRFDAPWYKKCKARDQLARMLNGPAKPSIIMTEGGCVSNGGSSLLVDKDCVLRRFYNIPNERCCDTSVIDTNKRVCVIDTNKKVVHRDQAVVKRKEFGPGWTREDTEKMFSMMNG